MGAQQRVHGGTLPLGSRVGLPAYGRRLLLAQLLVTDRQPVDVPEGIPHPPHQVTSRQLVEELGQDDAVARTTALGQGVDSGSRDLEAAREDRPLERGSGTA